MAGGVELSWYLPPCRPPGTPASSMQRPRSRTAAVTAVALPSTHPGAVGNRSGTGAGWGHTSEMPRQSCGASWESAHSGRVASRVPAKKREGCAGACPPGTHCAKTAHVSALARGVDHGKAQCGAADRGSGVEGAAGGRPPSPLVGRTTRAPSQGRTRPGRTAALPRVQTHPRSSLARVRTGAGKSERYPAYRLSLCEKGTWLAASRRHGRS